MVRDHRRAQGRTEAVGAGRRKTIHSPSPRNKGRCKGGGGDGEKIRTRESQPDIYKPYVCNYSSKAGDGRYANRIWCRGRSSWSWTRAELRKTRGKTYRRLLPGYRSHREAPGDSERDCLEAPSDSDILRCSWSCCQRSCQVGARGE